VRFDIRYRTPGWEEGEIRNRKEKGILEIAGITSFYMVLWEGRGN
jgi:hypothetical protein